ncbi:MULTISPECIES: LexA family transcriptional regulator [unclassified Gilliamella]|uniref:LexA family transcriptional regulator n=1 Tax=unclassified Gilliamella TaxID=2685620 RepID=UPI002269A3F7|nr:MULTISPECIES: LexA family transcriptional regulator [unclassified Gilliamella]MCX8573382.1 LexA family transcriptional regulator [Gilliamella sp. B3831]MCX8575990.1 LexA family transcriptional regulator [Gilliamella sp. B3815]MCX8579080.1 LexA family transcriptional regulator [Gilliamella sp. B2717]MCX8588184.1 LexA family transcriptional regulator [Gilliamella sp. B3801]MCX8589498.1 LexA family transcriptional regulator [Gilliamella sp. B3812]
MKESNIKTTEDQEKTRILKETGVIDFKHRLTLVLESLSGNAFAKKVGMSEAVIRDYLSGKTYPSLNRLAIIAQKCDIPIEWLATGKGECRLLPDTERRGFVYIPFYKLNEFGNNKSLLQIEAIPFDITLIKHQLFDNDDLRAVWAKGDSMEPTISNHDILIINTAHSKPIDGYLYAVQYDDQISIKRIQNQGSNIALLCDNQKYPSITVDKNEPQDFKIIGHVVYLLKDLY